MPNSAPDQIVHQQIETYAWNHLCKFREAIQGKDEKNGTYKRPYNTIFCDLTDYLEILEILKKKDVKQKYDFNDSNILAGENKNVAGLYYIMFKPEVKFSDSLIKYVQYLQDQCLNYTARRIENLSRSYRRASKGKPFLRIYCTTEQFHKVDPGLESALGHEFAQNNPKLSHLKFKFSKKELPKPFGRIDIYEINIETQITDKEDLRKLANIFFKQQNDCIDNLNRKEDPALYLATSAFAEAADNVAEAGWDKLNGGQRDIDYNVEKALINCIADMFRSVYKSKEKLRKQCGVFSKTASDLAACMTEATVLSSNSFKLSVDSEQLMSAIENYLKKYHDGMAYEPVYLFQSEFSLRRTKAREERARQGRMTHEERVVELTRKTHEKADSHETRDSGTSFSLTRTAGKRMSNEMRNRISALQSTSNNHESGASALPIQRGHVRSQSVMFARRGSGRRGTGRRRDDLSRPRLPSKREKPTSSSNPSSGSRARGQSVTGPAVTNNHVGRQRSVTLFTVPGSRGQRPSTSRGVRPEPSDQDMATSSSSGSRLAPRQQKGSLSHRPSTSSGTRAPVNPPKPDTAPLPPARTNPASKR